MEKGEMEFTILSSFIVRPEGEIFDVGRRGKGLKLTRRRRFGRGKDEYIRKLLSKREQTFTGSFVRLHDKPIKSPAHSCSHIHNTFPNM